DAAAVQEAVEAIEAMAEVILLGAEVVAAEDHAGGVVDPARAVAAVVARGVERGRQRRRAGGEVAHQQARRWIERAQAMLQVVEDEREQPQYRDARVVRAGVGPVGGDASDGALHAAGKAGAPPACRR